MAEEKTKSWGGARKGSGRKKGSPGIPGAGRKKTGRLKEFVTTSVSGSPAEIAALKALAEEAGKSVSRYVLDALVPPAAVSPEGADAEE